MEYENTGVDKNQTVNPKKNTKKEHYTNVLD